jgi:hypothetical protein
MYYVAQDIISDYKDHRKSATTQSPEERRLKKMERLLTFREAQDLGFGSRYSLRRWARLGRISVVKLGARTLRLRQADLEAFVKANIQLAREK